LRRGVSIERRGPGNAMLAYFPRSVSDEMDRDESGCAGLSLLQGAVRAQVMID
jgi:hypothetical protein